MIPVFLEGYDFFTELEAWRLAMGKRAIPTWSIHSVTEGLVGCTLRWQSAGKLYAVSQAATSIEETVWRALDRYKQEFGNV